MPFIVPPSYLDQAVEKIISGSDSRPIHFVPAPDVKPYFEFRERFERRLDKDFASHRRDNQSTLFSRVRVGATAKLSKEWTAEGMLQYMHDLNWTPSRNYSADNFDMAVAQMEYFDGRQRVNIGRQNINFSDGRLLSSSDWGNRGRTYDAVRFRTGNWDAMTGRIGVSSTRPPKLWLGAVSYKSDYGTSSFIYKNDVPTAGRVELYTLDHSYQSRFKGINFKIGGTIQWGRSQGKDLEAWALQFSASYRVAPKTTIGLDLNSASGGGNSNKTRTFDNLYASNHSRYGIIDMQGLRNMNEFSLKVTHEFSEPFSGMISWHRFTLRDASDGWYGDSGSLNRGPNGNFIDPTGTSGVHTGDELDLDLKYTLNNRTTFNGGFAIFSPGGFVKRLNGGSAQRQVWGYLSVTYKF